MKPIVQYIPLQPNTSFVASTFSPPNFEMGWHIHEAFEFILFTAGNGLVQIGNYESVYKSGDIFFLGSNLPHRFQPNDNITTAIIIQFKEHCLGKEFLNCPECQSLKQLLQLAEYGMQITRKTCRQLQPLIRTLEATNDLNRIIILLQCLQMLAAANKEHTPLNTAESRSLNPKDGDCIDKILKYTSDTFHGPVTLSQVAAIACKSIPSFCHYFKRRTLKTYIDYLNEVRVAYACNQLIQTNKPVVDIGHESGYNSITNFHRQFMRLKKTTPLQYRKIKTS